MKPELRKIDTKEYWDARFAGNGDEWQQDAINQCLQHMQGVISLIPERYGFTALQGLTVLDVGCATGEGTALLRQHAAEAEGIDYSKFAIEIAQKRFPEIHFEVKSVFEITKDYDCIICNFVLRHLVARAEEGLRHLQKHCERLVVTANEQYGKPVYVLPALEGKIYVYEN